MTRRIQVTFENGVLVPQEKINPPEHQRLTILVDEHFFPDDPPPDSGTDLVDWFSRHRLKVDPKLGQEIAESDEHIDQEPEDAP